MQRTCIVCGESFTAPPSSKKITCTAPCSREQKRRSHLGKHNTWNPEARARVAALGQTTNLVRGTPAAQQSPIAGPFETNREAKDWAVRNLETREIYEMRNLRLWCRTHADLFAPDPWELAYAGLRQVQASLLGRRKRPTTRWKDWTLVRPAQIPESRT